MQIIDSILPISDFKVGIVAIAILLLVLWVIKVVQRVRTNLQRVLKNREEVKYVQILRDSYKQDIKTFLNFYRNDVSTKLAECKAENGLFIFWSGAEEIINKFESDASEINKLPTREERIAIQSFYTEAKAFLDGILYNNHLLKKYQYLHCKVKTTTATSKEIQEVDDITEQMSTLGAQLQQQHQELLNSLQSARAYF